MVSAAVTHPALVAEVAARLAAAGVASPEVDARWLVEHVDDVAGEPTGCAAALLDALVERRAAREPLQLVLGHTAFRLLQLRCRRGVFIPRPETEVVAGLAIEAARASSAPVVIEPCTGAGPILCSLVAEVPSVRVVATDIEPTAVALAGENLERLVAGRAGVAGPAPGAVGEVHHGRGFTGVDPHLHGVVDVVVSNPPYLPASDAVTWAPEVAAYDPRQALIGGDRGHEVVVDLLSEASRWLRPGGAVVFEIDGRSRPAVIAAAATAGFVDVQVHRDLTGAVRAVRARLPAGGMATPS